MMKVESMRYLKRRFLQVFRLLDMVEMERSGTKINFALNGDS
jgi:hypothetical protein